MALEANEQLRVLLQVEVAPRRPVPAPVRGGHARPRCPRPACEEHDRPQTLLPIVDCQVDFLARTRRPRPLPNRRDAVLRTVAITLTVCGDAPVRLADLLDASARDVARPEDRRQ